MKSVGRFYKNELIFFKKSILPIFIAVIIFFIIAAVVSTFYYKNNPTSAFKQLSFFRHSIENLKKGPGLLVYLFRKNAIATLFSILLGWIPYLFLPLFILVTNASMMGAVFGFYFDQVTMAKILSGLLPHGIFEISACLYAVSLGVYWCFQKTRQRRQRSDLSLFDSQTQPIEVPG